MNYTVKIRDNYQSKCKNGRAHPSVILNKTSSRRLDKNRKKYFIVEIDYYTDLV